MAESPSKHCVAAAYASTAEGPFTPVNEPLFCDLASGGAIDADGFQDPVTGRQYVVYKVDGNAIGHGGACSNTVAPIAPTPLNLQEVSALDGYTPIGGQTTILLNDANDGPNIEAPSLAYNNGVYTLFYSSRCFTTTPYNVRYATSTSITGPYTKQPNSFLVTGSTAANVYIPGGCDKGWQEGCISCRRQHGMVCRRRVEATESNVRD
jgi:beta-xylosidase